MIYAVYSLNEDGDANELDSIYDNIDTARFFARSIATWRDPIIVYYDDDTIVPKTIDVE